MHSSSYQLPVRPAPFVEDAFLFVSFLLLYSFGFFVKGQVSIGVWVYFWVFDSIPLIDLSISVSLPCSFFFLITNALQYSLREVIPAVLLLFRISLLGVCPGAV